MQQRKLSLVSLTVLVTLCLAAAAGATQPRLMLAGDSWAWFLWLNSSFQQALEERDIDAGVEGLYTTVPGSEAREWLDEKFLAQLTAQLEAHPTVDIVHLSIGGNDFLRRWQPDMTAAEEKALFSEITADTEQIIQHILAVRPDIRVALSDYDYINKTKRGCTLEAINTAGQRLAKMRIAMTQQYDRVAYIHNYGLMQYRFGIPGAFEPEQVPYPENDPDFAAFPGGNTQYGNPEAAMFDDIHLNGPGYLELARHCVDAVYAAWLGAGSAITPHARQTVAAAGELEAGAR